MAGMLAVIAVLAAAGAAWVAYQVFITRGGTAGDLWHAGAERVWDAITPYDGRTVTYWEDGLGWVTETSCPAGYPDDDDPYTNGYYGTGEGR